MVTSYKDTLHLPQTNFPMKADLAREEPKTLEVWESTHLYEQMIARVKDRPRYILHDGPPYANGHLHLGTILNKILKDIVVKYKNMSGFCCEFIPGWDCHGLPIELEAVKLLGEKKKTMSPVERRAACRAHAEQFIDIQRREFKRLGVLGRWEKPYITMSPEYEATIAREFGRLVANDLVYKGKKPITWCTSCRTALAEAEVEYADHTSPSIYVAFRLEDDVELRQKWKLGKEPISLLIWTTTPWTIPANTGLSLHPDFTYVGVRVDGGVWVVAEELKDGVLAATGKQDAPVVGTCLATELEKKKCRHPLIDRHSIIVLGEHVTADTGTGVVHTAPGHGQEDFIVGNRYGLPALSPVDDGGCFTNEVGLSWLIGVHVEKANPIIVEKLREVGALVAAQSVSHSYPHCWRCKRPVIFRLTAQWFISMEKGELRQRALQAIDGVEWIPPWGKNRIGGMVEQRPDWCVSRQRLWGVPIVAVVCESCGTSHTTADMVERAAAHFEKNGTDTWYTEPVETFVPKDFACPQCGKGTRFRKEQDILDVWFDSGVSYAAVLEREIGKGTIADLYLEGSDQHRGWFHTSLLTSIGTRQRAPYKRVLTHGFVVDGEGRKYSKSAKNYVPPEKLIDQHGVEILRLWVAAEDYRDDIRFSDVILTRLVESYRKIRNTCRYLLGNLSDFDPQRDAVPYEQMEEIDRWAMHVLQKLIERVRHGYETFEFHTIYHTLNRFTTVELSAFYLDILKDRLYTERKDGKLRRSAQTVLWNLADTLTRLMAPILSFTAHEVWSYLPKKKGTSDVVLLNDLPSVDTKTIDEKLGERWERLMTVRSAVTKVLEESRAAKTIGNPLEAQIVIAAPKELAAFLKSFGATLSDLFIVSGVEFGEEVTDLKVTAQAAAGKKCARCWKYATTVGQSASHPEICARCVGVVST